MELAPEFADPRAGARVRELVAAVGAAGGRTLLVGGCVRDAALGRPLREVDVEVFGLAPEALRRIGEGLGARAVGRHFPILRLRDAPVDVALPRHGPPAPGAGFEADAAPDQPVEEALARRDFTINAMAWDPASGAWIDPHGGRADLAARRLRHTSARFGEDPVRVLRGMQLVARFDLAPDPATVALCRGLAPGDAPRERLCAEWKKLLLLGGQIARGLGFLRGADWLRFTPELAALVDCPQDPEWHPEGDVWVHTGHCLDAFARSRLDEPREDWIVGLAVLCHDLGKPDTSRRRGGRITARGHEERGAELTRAFLRRLTGETELVDEVAVLVAHHLAPSRLHRERERVGDAAVRRLARRVGRIDRLVRVAEADHRGRPPLDAPFEAGPWLLGRARALAVARSAPAPLVRGRDLLPLGLAPGAELGRWLDACYDAQIEGAIATREQGVAWVAARLGGESV